MRSLVENAPHFMGHTGKKPHEKRIKRQENIRELIFYFYLPRNSVKRLTNEIG